MGADYLKSKGAADMGVFDNVGKVLSIHYVPCTPSPQLWVKSARIALLKLFFSIDQPVWKAVIKWTTGKSWLKHLKNDSIINAVLDAEHWDGKAFMMFEIAEAIDKFTFWVWVADVISDFLWNWTSMTYQLAGCKLGQFDETDAGIAPFSTATTANVWMAGPLWQMTVPNPGDNLTSDFVVPGGTKFSFNCAFSAVGLFSGKQLAIGIRLVRTTDGMVLADSQQSKGDADNGYSAMIGTQQPAAALVPITYQLQWIRLDTTGDAIIITHDGYMTITFGDGGRDL